MNSTQTRPDRRIEWEHIQSHVILLWIYDTAWKPPSPKLGIGMQALQVYKRWAVDAPSSAVPSGSPTVLQRSVATFLLFAFVMLSRFSSLFVYVVAGLAISAAATPGFKPKAAPYDPPSYPPAPGPQQYSPAPQPYQPSPPPYQPSPPSYQPPPQPGYKGPQGSYPPSSYNNEYQCNVGEQQCCDSTNYVSYLCNAHLRWLITDTFLQLKDSDSSVTTGFLSAIFDSLPGDTLVGKNCRSIFSLQSNCKAEPMCCNHNYNVRLCLFSSFFSY
jgi:hypothetical protein